MRQPILSPAATSKTEQASPTAKAEQQKSDKKKIAADLNVDVD